MKDFDIDVPDVLKKVSLLNQVIKSPGLVGTLVKKHVFSERFTELRSLLLDYKQLLTLEQCSMRDVLIKDIIQYLNDPHEIALSEKLRLSLVENENLRIQIETLMNKLLVIEQERASEVEGVRLSLSLDVRRLKRVEQALKMCVEYRSSITNLTFLQYVDKDYLLTVLGSVIENLKS